MQLSMSQESIPEFHHAHAQSRAVPGVSSRGLAPSYWESDGQGVSKPGSGT